MASAKGREAQRQAEEGRTVDNKELAQRILELIGGKGNISSYTHCITRLRVIVKDLDVIDNDAIAKLKGVMGTNTVGMQYQVILGPKVTDVYNAFADIVGPMDGGDVPADGGAQEKKSIGSTIIDTLTGIFVPILPAIIGAGIIKGILLALMFAGVVDPSTNEYQLLSIFSDAAFYFLPILLAASTADHFKCNKYVAMAIGGILVHPDLVTLMTGDAAVSFLGLPIFKTTYGSSVVPIVLAILFMSYVERFLNKHVPAVLRTIAVPVLTTLIVAPVTLWVLGPIGTIVSNFLASNFVTFYLNFGVIAGALFAGFYPLLVLLGIHNGFTPVMVQNLATYGVEYLMGLMVPSNSAEAGATWAVFFRTKNKEFKEIAGSAAVSATLGITEPALYGVTAKLKKPLIAACIGGAVGGAIAGFFHVTATGIGTGPIVGIPLFLTDTFIYFVISCVASFVISFVMTLVLGFDDPAAEDSDAEDATLPEPAADEKPVVLPVSLPEKTLGAAVAGEAKPLSECQDAVFASGAMGKGVVIVPSGNKVYAPCAGTLTTLFPTLHALGITSDDGAEVLVHVGMDTVGLNGEGFVAHARQGQRVEAGQLILEFDPDLIHAKGLITDTPVIVTNADEFPQLEIVTGTVRPGDPVIRLG